MIYRIADPKLNNWEKLEAEGNMKNTISEFTAKFLYANKLVVVCDYNVTVGLGMKMFVEDFSIAIGKTTFCASFFHDDCETKQIQVPGFDDILKLRTEIIENMEENLPYIKKLHVPLGFELGVEYITDMLNELN